MGSGRCGKGFPVCLKHETEPDQSLESHRAEALPWDVAQMDRARD